VLTYGSLYIIREVDDYEPYPEIVGVYAVEEDAEKEKARSLVEFDIQTKNYKQYILDRTVEQERLVEKYKEWHPIGRKDRRIEIGMEEFRIARNFMAGWPQEYEYFIESAEVK